MAAHQFHVIIIGGSIAGLTLAHSLSSASINFTVLESRIDPFTDGKAGAGLLLLPNGARILNQLGVYDGLSRQCQSVYHHSTWLEDGRLLRRIDMQSVSSSRTGYPCSVISRQALLKTLYDSLSDNHRVLFGKKVVRITSTDLNVQVKCDDGSSISGDIVIGADGIHSRTRNEMQRHIRQNQLPPPPRSDPSERIAFSGLFGISNPTVGLERGHAHRTYGHGWSMIVTVGTDERVYWYVAIRADENLLIGNETSKIAARFLDKHVTGTVRFGEIFRNAISCTHVPLEESLEREWAYNRIACTGDAVHKMTPNIAQGANCAIETAAALANHIIASTPDSRLVTSEDTHHLLDKWDYSHWWRMKAFSIASWILVRVEASSGWACHLLGLYIGYFHGELVIGMLSDISCFTQRLEHLPVPERTVKSQEGGIGWSSLAWKVGSTVSVAVGVYTVFMLATR